MISNEIHTAAVFASVRQRRSPLRQGTLAFGIFVNLLGCDSGNRPSPAPTVANVVSAAFVAPDHPTVSLLDAAKAGSLPQVQSSLYWCRKEGGCDVNHRDPDGRTALHHAAYRGQEEMTRLLLDAVADLNLQDNIGWTPLFMAVVGRANADYIHFLLKAGALVGVLDKEGATALHYAEGDIVRILIENGVSVNARDNDGVTALFRSSQLGDLVAVKALIAAGANPNELSKQASVTPLYVASANGKTEVVRLLIDAGADVKAEMYDRETCLHTAALAGHADVAKLLIEAGSNVNAQDKSGATPMHHAAYKGSTGVALVLIKAGANVNTRDRSQKTPLKVAMREGHSELAALIRANGGKE